MNATRVSELTVAELMELIEVTVRKVLAEAAIPSLEIDDFSQLAVLDIPTLKITPWPEGLESISRAELYGNDER